MTTTVTLKPLTQILYRDSSESFKRQLLKEVNLLQQKGSIDPFSYLDVDLQKHKKQFESQFARKYKLESIEKNFALFQNVKQHRYSKEYLTKLFDLLHYDKKDYLEKRNLLISSLKSKSTPNILSNSNSCKNININTNTKSKEFQSTYSTRRAYQILQSPSTIREYLKVHNLINTNHNDGKDYLKKYDKLIDPISDEDSNKEGFKEKLIKMYLNKTYADDNKKDDTCTNAHQINREEMYKYYDEKIMNNYGKMFINLSNNIFFFPEVSKDKINALNLPKSTNKGRSAITDKDTHLKYMRERSDNHERASSGKMKRPTHSHNKVLKLKNK